MVTSIPSTEPARPGGVRADVAVACLVIDNLASAAETFPAPVLVEGLDRLLATLTRPIEEQGGIVDHFCGDTLVALFGPGEAADGSAGGIDPLLQACRAALAQQAVLPALNEGLSDRLGWPVELSLRGGLAGGPALTGQLASLPAQRRVVLGDVAKLAPRLDAANRIYGTRLLAAGPRLAGAAEALALREIDHVVLRGQTDAIGLFELPPPALERGRWLRLCDAYAAALQAYRARDFEQAWQGFDRCLELVPDDRPSQVLLQRLDLFVLEPPAADWDGAWHLTDLA